MSTVPTLPSSVPAEPTPSGQLALAIPVKVESPPAVQARAQPQKVTRTEVELPTTQPFPAPGLPVILDLGARRLVANVGPEGVYLCDESGARVKSLRKSKLDDPRAFARAKVRWLELRTRGTTDFDLDAAWLYLIEHMLRTGQSATGAELRAAWATPAGPRNLASTVWVELESGAPLRWDEGQLTLMGEPLSDLARARLGHPARNRELELSGLQAMRARYEPSEPEALEVMPRVGRIRGSTLGRILTGHGFEGVGSAATAWHLLAPELGGVGVVRCDLTGHPCLSFRRWKGTVEGGAVLRLGQVDPQLFAEAYEALLVALPCE